MTKKSSMKIMKLMIFKEMENIPIPSSISYWWNFGSLLGICLLIQILSGLFLTFQYKASVNEAFGAVISIAWDVSSGWMIRSIHSNGASAFFICVYFHIGRGLYYKSFMLKWTWLIGIVIFLLLMGTSFLGYVLPWGQMSFWGATVITSLLSAIPYLGDYLVQWIWGGFSVSGPTLTRFFGIHFLLPIIILVLVLFHLISLHYTGSSNPLGLSPNSDKSFFHPYFLVKDILGIMVMILIFSFVVFETPDLFMDPDNFMEANPMITPPHIQPEWYFLFAYTILRSIPSKLGGVVGLLMSIVILCFLPFLSSWKKVNTRFLILKKINFWIFAGSFFILTWLGSQPVENPFTLISQLASILYFLSILFISI